MNDVEAKMFEQPLYEVAEREVGEMLPHDLDQRLITPHALRTMMIACWLRGETYHRSIAQ